MNATFPEPTNSALRKEVAFVDASVAGWQEMLRELPSGIEVVTLDAGAGYASYLWSPGGAKTQKINVTVSGKYLITVSDVNGCSAKDSSNVTFTTLPQVSIGLRLFLLQHGAR